MIFAKFEGLSGEIEQNISGMVSYQSVNFELE